MSSIVRRNLSDAIAVLEKAAQMESRMQEAANTIAEALLLGQKLLTCGNGGSAADASHMSTEFVSRFNRERRPYPAISLAAHGGDLTAIGNDYSFEDLFARQVQAFGKPGDVLAVFTTSGQSENIRRALLEAKSNELNSIAFLGRDGGKCRGIADIEFLITSDVTARIQEAHKFLLHTICEMVEERLLKSAIAL